MASLPRPEGRGFYRVPRFRSEWQYAEEAAGRWSLAAGSWWLVVRWGSFHIGRQRAELFDVRSACSGQVMGHPGLEAGRRDSGPEGPSFHGFTSPA